MTEFNLCLNLLSNKYNLNINLSIENIDLSTCKLTNNHFIFNFDIKPNNIQVYNIINVLRKNYDIVPIKFCKINAKLYLKDYTGDDFKSYDIENGWFNVLYEEKDNKNKICCQFSFDSINPPIS